MIRQKCKYCSQVDWGAVDLGCYYEPFAKDCWARFCLHESNGKWQICCENDEDFLYFGDIKHCPMCGRKLSGR